MTVTSWPDLSLPGWRVEFLALPPGRHIWTCRRWGVTWQIVRHADGQWTGTRFKGGQVTAELESSRVPAAMHQRLREAKAP